MYIKGHIAHKLCQTCKSNTSLIILKKTSTYNFYLKIKYKTCFFYQNKVKYKLPRFYHLSKNSSGNKSLNLPLISIHERRN